MSKRVNITAEIQSKMRTAVGDPDLNTATFAVYEARMLSTEPLTKSGLLQNARMSASVLQEMVSLINQDANAVPLQIMHDDSVLPIGRVFSAKLMNLPNGELELRGLFMIPLYREEIIKDLDNSIIDEVSVGVVTKSAICSECGFDYLGPDADIMNYLDLTCDKGHTIGVDGTHVRLVGLMDWLELSLVGNGAAKNAKILPRAKQSMSKEMLEKLAASRTPVEARIVTSLHKMNEKGDPVMDLEKLVIELKTTTADLTKSQIELQAAIKLAEDLTKELNELKLSAQASADKIVELEAAKTVSFQELETQLSEVKGKIDEIAEKLTPHVKAALIASGAAETDLPSDIMAQLALIEEKGLKLHQIITPGAKSDVTKVENGQGSDDSRKGSFKLSK